MEDQEVILLARHQLTVLVRQDALPPGCSIGLSLVESGTTLVDLNGTKVLIRVRLTSERGDVGYADVATAPELGSVLFSVTRTKAWDEDAIRREAEKQGLPSQGAFVAYAYPKVGLEIERTITSRSVFDWIEGRVVSFGDPFLEEANVVRSYSMIDSLEESLRRSNRQQYDALVRELSLNTGEEELTKAMRHQIQYSGYLAGHTCFELRTQRFGEWCVPASVEMLLAFYRYKYDQDDIAVALGQRDANRNQIELAVGREYGVVDVVSFLTCQALVPRMYPNEAAFWGIIMTEILNDRPLILFTGGHSRVIAGFSLCTIGSVVCGGLTLYDPAEVEVCWEYYNKNTELLLFSASLRQAKICAQA
jgi:hypothetical protein